MVLVFFVITGYNINNGLLDGNFCWILDYNYMEVFFLINVE